MIIFEIIMTVLGASGFIYLGTLFTVFGKDYKVFYGWNYAAFGTAAAFALVMAIVIIKDIKSKKRGQAKAAAKGKKANAAKLPASLTVSFRAEPKGKTKSKKGKK